MHYIYKQTIGRIIQLHSKDMCVWQVLLKLLILNDSFREEAQVILGIIERLKMESFGTDG